VKTQGQYKIFIGDFAQMDNSIIRSWNGRLIRQRKDGYLSATDMCQACNKRWNNWYRLDSTREYLEALQRRNYSDVSNSGLIDSTVGNVGGTWIYRKVAIRLAQWLSPDFAVSVDEWIEEVLFSAYKEQEQKVLPLSRETQANLLFALKDIHDVDPDDRTRVILKAQIINLVESAQQADPEPQLLSVTEICEMNGIKIPHGKDSMLGKIVARTWRQIHDTDPQVCKKHLDTGHVSEIKAYPPEFFERVIAVAQEYLK
jgi:KilA-N domain